MDEFLLLKLLPFEKKLEWFAKNLESNQYNIDLLGKVILSDLCQELEVYSKNSWSGLMTKKLIDQRMMILSKFVKNSYLSKILSHEVGRRIFLDITINYSYTVKKITSFKDYLWFYRNKRVVKSVCEGKLSRFIREHFNKERGTIEGQVNALKAKMEEISTIFNNYIRPFHNNDRALINKDLHCGNDFLVDLDSIPQNIKDMEFPQIKVDQNKFFDPISGFYNKEARQAALNNGKNNCYFDLAEMWNEYVDSALFGVKEFSKQTLIEKSKH